jgi:hypothetical protein
MTTRLSVAMSTLLVCGLAVTSSPAYAQVHARIGAGSASTGLQAPVISGAAGARFGLVEVDVEGGRYWDILPGELSAALDDLQGNSPVRAAVRLPATYALGELRLISPVGPVRPFVGVGLGLARVHPQVDLVVGGFTFNDVTRVFDITPQNAALASIGGGVRFEAGVGLFEVGYRYTAVLWDLPVGPDLAGVDAVTRINAVHASLGFQF